MQFLYTNVELNLPHHLNYVAALPYKCTQRIVHVKPLTFCAKKHHTTFRRTCGIQISQIWTLSITRPLVIMQHRVYQTKICNVDERRVIDVWCGLKQSTTNTALITSVEDFERASIRKEDNYSNTTCELTLLILSVSVTFSVTFVVWLLPCYIFHSKSVPATSTIGLQDCLFYKVVQRQNHAVWHAEKIIKIG